jgi:hypothetical protein
VPKPDLRRRRRQLVAHLRKTTEAGHLTRHGDGTPRRFYTYSAKGGTA